MLTSKRKNGLLGAFVFVVALMVGPLMQLKFGALMPGDLGDPRLNNYFLENIYQVLIGRSDSLWHLGFFYPHPWILGLSDNLFGAAPIYVVQRLLQIPSDTAFQVWLLVSYAANYAAAYVALRRLKASPPASIAGALIFAFALPIPSQFQHVQLLYRFGAALAIGEVGRFVLTNDWRRLYAAGGWLVWQFYCSIYIGFFTVVFMGAVLVVHAIGSVIRTVRARGTQAELADVPNGTDGPVSDKLVVRPSDRWQRLGVRDKLTLVGAPVAGVAALGWLLYPYIQASRIFGAGRTFPEIEKDMPRWWSYLVSDHSLIWSRNANLLGVGHFEEHQLFIGLIASVLLVGGLVLALRHPSARVGRTYGVALIATFVLSLDVGGHSLWAPLVHLPLFSAIRVVSRFDLVWLFPIAYLAGLTVDWLLEQVSHRRASRVGGPSQKLPLVVFGVVAALIVAEYSLVVPSTTPKQEWRSRIAAIDAKTPQNLPEDAIIAAATPEAPWHCAMELDAMWEALNRGVYTMNGYAGFGLPGYNLPAGSDRSQVIERIGWYLVYAGQAGNVGAYQQLASQVVLVGFDESDTSDRSWLESPHTFTLAEDLYSEAAIDAITVNVVGADPDRGMGVIDIDIHNGGTELIAAESYLGKPVEIAWRLVDADGDVSPWHFRALPCDLAPGGTERMRVLIDEVADPAGSTVEFGVVQTGAEQPEPADVGSSRIEWSEP